MTNFKEKSDYAHLLNTELRHIEASKLNKLSVIIDESRDCSKLLDALTRSNRLLGQDSNQSLRLTSGAISLIKQQIYCGKSPTLALLNHWAITGRRRPTVVTLLNRLRECNLKRAEDYVCQAVLGLVPTDSPRPSISLRIDRQKPRFDVEDCYRFDDLTEVVENLHPDCSKYSFELIYESTNGFCHKPFDLKTMSGSKVGEGRFSSVFRAKTHLERETGDHQSESRVFAAKLLKSECNMKLLSNEVDLTLKVKHPNVLKFFGVAIGCQENDERPHFICLIYELMLNGSLLSCLNEGVPTENMRFLSWRERVGMAVKIARGISYLHSSLADPIIHRDIKTANIFIDHDLEPKIGDFTLVRQLVSNETQFSQNIIGTSVYMPPEAFRGDISTKFDTFSFGIVLLELLTGLKPFQEDASEDLFTYITGRLSDIEENLSESNEASEASIEDARDEFLNEILDRRAGDWSFYCSKKLFYLALKATETRKKDRPELVSILSDMDPLIGWTVLVD